MSTPGARLALAAVLALGLMLAGCGAERKSCRQWMEQQRREVKAAERAPLTPPKKFTPQALHVRLEPSSRSAPEADGGPAGSRQPNSLLAAGINRRKEPLEAYPLDSMRMVGSVVTRRPYALREGVDNLLYQVKAGDYIGQNYGVITIDLGDRTGRWRDRAGRSGRVDRTRQRPPTSRRRRDEAQPGESDHEHGGRVRALAPRAGIGAPLAGGPERDPVDQQHAAGHLRGGPHRTQRAAGRRSAGFTIQTPPRIAIDLPGVSNALGRNPSRSTRATCAASTSRRPASARACAQPRRRPTKAQLQGKSLVLVVDTAPPRWRSRPSTGRAGALRREPNREQLALKDIDFRRGNDGAGRVVVELPNNQVGVDIRQQGQSLVVEFLRSTPARTACASVSTSPTSARRCRASPPRSRVTACA